MGVDTVRVCGTNLPSAVVMIQLACQGSEVVLVLCQWANISIGLGPCKVDPEKRMLIIAPKGVCSPGVEMLLDLYEDESGPRPMETQTRTPEMDKYSSIHVLARWARR